MKPRVLVVGQFPPAAGGITSLLTTIFSSKITQHYELVPFNIGRPAKPNVINNTGYTALLNAGMGRALLAIRLTLWHMAIFPLRLLVQRPAIVHIHTAQYLLFWEMAYYVLVARLFRIPCGMQFHYSFRLFYEASGRWSQVAILWVMRWATVFIVICQEDQAFITQSTSAIRHCVYLPNFIDVQAVQKSVQQSREHLEKDETVVVLFLGGSESIRKGLFDLLQVISMSKNTPSKVRFLLTAVPQEAVEQRLAKEVVSRCDIQGWVSGGEKTNVFAEADIFVLPSYGEGMPIGILEAMASSMPVIATQVGGIPDMIADGQEGYLLDPGDIKGLARVIFQLADDTQTRENMGAKGLEKALEMYDLSVGFQRLEKLYEEMLQPGYSLSTKVSA